MSWLSYAKYTPPKETAEPTPRAVLSVYWCGTDGDKRRMRTLIEAMAAVTNGLDISDPSVDVALGTGEKKQRTSRRRKPNDAFVASSSNGGDGGDVEDAVTSNTVYHFKMCISGCGVTNGFTGVIFGAGIPDQAEEVKTRALEIIRKLKCTLILNLIGFSRGAIGCLRAAKLFHSDYFGEAWKNWLTINLMAIDPVPGNFLTTTRLFNFVGMSHDAKVSNMTGIDLLNRALVIYMVDPLDHSLAHAPSVPQFDDGVCVMDVSLGCHAGAMALPSSAVVRLTIGDSLNQSGLDAFPSSSSSSSSSSGTRVYGGLDPDYVFGLDVWMMYDVMLNFMNAHGTSISDLADRVFPSDVKKMVEKMTALKSGYGPNHATTRLTHTSGVTINRREGGTFLNKLHQTLFFGHYHSNDSDDWRSRPYYYARDLPDGSHCLYID
jgi:hypothetical protein